MKTPGGFPCPASPANDPEVLINETFTQGRPGRLAALASGLAIAVAFAHPGGMGPGMMHSGDAAFQADMRLVHEMLAGHDAPPRAARIAPQRLVFQPRG